MSVTVISLAVFIHLELHGGFAVNDDFEFW